MITRPVVRLLPEGKITAADVGVKLSGWATETKRNLFYINKTGELQAKLRGRNR